jgi:DNA polymerase I
MGRLTILLDADVICHQFAYLNTQTISFDGVTPLEHLNPEKARNDVDSYIFGLKEKLESDDLIVVLSDPNANFRKELCPTYKAGRSEKPALWHEIRAFLEQEQMDHETVSYPRLEGDDVLGLLATNEYLDRSIIVSIDKDMQTIPGLLFNPAKDTAVRRITEIDAVRYHATQTITGDQTDGYPGLPKAGPVTAAKTLGDLTDPVEIWEAVQGLYESKGRTRDDMLLQARLAFILRDNHYNRETNRIRLWNPPANTPT